MFNQASNTGNSNHINPLTRKNPKPIRPHRFNKSLKRFEDFSACGTYCVVALIALLHHRQFNFRGNLLGLEEDHAKIDSGFGSNRQHGIAAGMDQQHGSFFPFYQNLV